MSATFSCPACGWSAEAVPAVWRCGTCGGPLSFAGEAPPPVSLGGIVTPVLDWQGLTLKLEGALPTGSFKDRGAAAMAGWLRAHRVERVIEDSSGNAGAALAAHCARAGIGCDIYAPEATPPAKLAQIIAYGARIVPVPGPRPRATEAAMAAAEAGAVYASHAWSPLFLEGTRSFAGELLGQLGEAPEAIVFPVGGGSLLLGAHLGFRRLRDEGTIDRLPRLVCAQAAACAPLVAAFEAGSPDPLPVEMSESVADGIRIPEPVRGAEVLRALAETDGIAVAVEEDEILAAYRDVALGGVLVERTSAVALAAAAKLGLAGRRIVVAVTGHGLKTPPGPGGTVAA